MVCRRLAGNDTGEAQENFLTNTAANNRCDFYDDTQQTQTNFLTNTHRVPTTAASSTMIPGNLREHIS